jgi:hypothetical protein
MTSTAVSGLETAPLPRSFTLTPEMVRTPEPAASQSSLPAVNTGMRLAAAGLAVALAGVMIVDRASLGGDEEPAREAQTAAVPESAADSPPTGEFRSGEQDSDDAAADAGAEVATAVPAPTPTVGTSGVGAGAGGVGTTFTPAPGTGGGGVGGAASSGGGGVPPAATAVPQPSPPPVEAPTPEETESALRSQGAADESNEDVVAAPEAEETSAPEPEAAPAADASDDSETSALALLEGLLAVLLGASLGGLILLAVVRRTERA